MLPQKKESLLNRDSSRRKSCVSQAMAKTNKAERQAAMLAQQTALQKSLEKAEKSADDAEYKANGAKTRIDIATAEEAKAQTSRAAMSKLLAQLQERKVAILQEQTAVLETDASERALLAQRVQDHVAAATAEASRADADNIDAESGTPLAENRRLRAALLALVDDFDAKQAAHKAALHVSTAATATLETELSHARETLAAAEASATDVKQVREATNDFSKKFRGFSESAEGSKSAFSERVAALDAANNRRRDAMLTVREAKAGRALAKKELSAALERVAPAETALQQAEATLRKVAALRDTLRARVEAAGLEVN